MSLYLGADGGQTHSQAVLIDAKGRLLGVGDSGPCNHYSEPGGPKRFRTALQEMTLNAFKSAGVPIETEVAAACFGLTGNWFRAEPVVRRFLKPDAFLAVEDTITAHAGALAGEVGIVLIAGTGAVAYGRTLDGRTARSGGLGYLLSDEGAGYDIGQQGLRAAVQAWDGRGPKTILVELFLEQLKVPDFESLTGTIYGSRDLRAVVANLTPIVAQAAHSADPVAIHIFEAAAEQLGLCVLAVAERLDWSAPRVGTTGGVFKAGWVILDPLTTFLARRLPGAVLVPGRYPPVIGAGLLALQAGGIEIDETILFNMDRESHSLGHT